MTTVLATLAVLAWPVVAVVLTLRVTRRARTAGVRSSDRDAMADLATPGEGATFALTTLAALLAVGWLLGLAVWSS